MFLALLRVRQYAVMAECAIHQIATYSSTEGKMDHRRKIPYAILETLALIGLVVFAFQFAGVNFLPPGNGSQTAYPPPGGTQVYTPLPTYTPVPARTPTPTPIVLDNGWYLYTDPDGEFSFAYPPIALITGSGQNPVDLSKNIILQFNLPDKSYQGMSIRVESNPKRLQGIDIAVKLFEDSSQKPVPAEFVNSLKQISVGGKPGVLAHIPSTNTEVTVIIPYDDKVVILAPVHNPAATKVEEETLKVFFQILDTFKFR